MDPTSDFAKHDHQLDVKKFSHVGHAYTLTKAQRDRLNMPFTGIFKVNDKEFS